MAYTRDGSEDELEALGTILGHLDLRPTDAATASLAAALGASNGLRAADAVHLATAVAVGADRFRPPGVLASREVVEVVRRSP